MPVIKQDDYFSNLYGKIFFMYKNLGSSDLEALQDENGVDLLDENGRVLEEEI